MAGLSRSFNANYFGVGERRYNNLWLYFWRFRRYHWNSSLSPENVGWKVSNVSNSNGVLQWNASLYKRFIWLTDRHIVKSLWGAELYQATEKQACDRKECEVVCFRKFLRCRACICLAITWFITVFTGCMCSLEERASHFVGLSGHLKRIKMHTSACPSQLETAPSTPLPHRSASLEWMVIGWLVEAEDIVGCARAGASTWLPCTVWKAAASCSKYQDRDLLNLRHNPLIQWTNDNEDKLSLYTTSVR